MGVMEVMEVMEGMKKRRNVLSNVKTMSAIGTGILSTAWKTLLIVLIFVRSSVMQGPTVSVSLMSLKTRVNILEAVG